MFGRFGECATASSPMIRGGKTNFYTSDSSGESGRVVLLLIHSAKYTENPRGAGGACVPEEAEKEFGRSTWWGKGCLEAGPKVPGTARTLHSPQALGKEARPGDNRVRRWPFGAAAATKPRSRASGGEGSPSGVARFGVYGDELNG